MATAAELAILIRARDEASVALAGVQKEASGLSRTLGTGLKIAAAGGAAAIGAFAFKSIGAASDLNEAVSKANVTFGDSAELVREFAEDSASSFGISKRAANEYTATLGNILQATGLTQEASADMSIELTKLAADIASFNNLDFDVALEKIRAGLVGEAEPLRTVGVLLSEAAVQQEAYSSGIADVGATLTEAEKVQARYNIILAQTTTAQGDFERTSEGVANQQRILRAEFEDAAAALGAKLQPAMKLAIAAAITFVGTLKDTVEVVDENKDLIAAFAAATLGALLVPKLIAATQATAAFVSVLSATATAQRVSVFTALIRSLTLPSIGLPALAIAAVAAGLGIFGLVRAMRGGGEAARDYAAEVKRAGDAAEFANFDRQIAEGDQLAEQYLDMRDRAKELATEHERLAAIAEPLTQAYLLQGETWREDARQAGGLLLQLLEVEEAEARLRGEQAALGEVGKTLALNQFQVAAVIERTGLSAQGAATIFPAFADEMDKSGRSADELAEDLKTSEDAMKAGTDAVKGLAAALESDLAAAFRSLATVRTSEVVALESQIAAVEAYRAALLAQAGGIEDNLLPAQQSAVDQIDTQLDALNAQKDALLAVQEAQGLQLESLADLAISQDDLNEILKTARERLSDQEFQTFLATAKTQGWQKAIDDLRTTALGPMADDLQQQLIPSMGELVGLLSDAEIAARGFFGVLADFATGGASAVDIFRALPTLSSAGGGAREQEVAPGVAPGGARTNEGVRRLNIWGPVTVQADEPAAFWRQLEGMVGA